MEIKRDVYLDRLIVRKHNGLIKVITGIRRSGKSYLLLDEVQKLGAFESVLNGFLRRENLDVYVTGSNFKFLSKDILTEFRVQRSWG